MAKMKAKKKVKKKVSTYDDRLIKIIAISLAAAVVVIVAVVAAFAYGNSYVCKVGGKRVMTYEYEFFLGSKMEEMESDAREAFEEEHKDDEDAKFDAAAFWTAEKIGEAKTAALDEVREWKAEYLLAVKEGYGMSKKERNEYAANIENNLYYMWYLQYQSYSYENFLRAYLGNLSMKEYQTYALQDKCIMDYRAALEEGYTPTEEQLREKYESDIDTYRRVSMLTLAIEKPEKPEEVTDPGEEPEKPNTEDKTSAEWIAYEAAKATYDKQLKAYQEYVEKKEDYDKEVAELKEQVDAIFAQLLEKGKYTGKGIVEVEEDKDKDEDKKESETQTKAVDTDDLEKKKNVKDYTDATLEDLAKTESALFASTGGAYDFTKASETEDLIIDDYALSLDWTSSARDAINTSLEDEEDGYKNSFVTESEKDSDGKVKTKLILIQDDTYFYITQCTGIKDFDTSVESTDSETSVRDTVKTDLLSDLSEAELKEKVKNAGSKYEVKSKKQKAIDNIADGLFG